MMGVPAGPGPAALDPGREEAGAPALMLWKEAGQR